LLPPRSILLVDNPALKVAFFVLSRTLILSLPPDVFPFRNRPIPNPLSWRFKCSHDPLKSRNFSKARRPDPEEVAEPGVWRGVTDNSKGITSFIMNLVALMALFFFLELVAYSVPPRSGMLFKTDVADAEESDA
jgi:hypothetical protein